MQKGVIKLKKQPCIYSCAAVVGQKEFDGPLREYFDMHGDDDKFGKKTWEKAESEMQRLALNLALAKKKLQDTDIDAIFAGDLINQCTSSAYGLCDFDVPYFGLYGACSTMAESLMLSSLLIEGGIFRKCAAVTSSHFCSSERQFRFPLEYGGQRTPTSQWTVTGAGASILSDDDGYMYVTEVLPGRVIDKGVTDVNNMGAAMAPAAYDTLTRYFNQTKSKPEDFDLILTGDLGFEGHSIVRDFMKQDSCDISRIYNDCGLMIFDREKQDVHAGGSGCGCSASVFNSYIANGFLTKKYKEILFVATGALMSPMSLFQGNSIPAIAHLLRISSQRKYGGNK